MAAKRSPAAESGHDPQESTHSSVTPGTSNDSEGPPVKKPRLTIKGPKGKRPDEPSAKTLGKRPQRQSRNPRPSYSEETAVMPQESPASSSSDLSELTSNSSPDPGPVEDLREADYGDLMSYYVTNEDSPAGNAIQTPTPPSEPTPQPVGPPSKTKRSKSSPKAKATRQSRETAKRAPVAAAPSESGPNAPDPSEWRPNGPDPPPTTVEPPPRKQDDVPTMIKKLEELSERLAKFGGVPRTAKSPLQETKNPLDGFLAIFSDGSPIAGNDYRVASPGIPDWPLTYGIEFIINALRTWAHTRIREHLARQGPQPKALKRSVGRPRKFEGSGYSEPAQTLHYTLENTPEGYAIASFQEVLSSGALQVNAIVPVALSRALRHVYMQIDQLINQSGKAKPQWFMMSYGSQIAANKTRVEAMKATHLAAQQEMARQKTAMRTPNELRTQLQHQIELERRRSMQQSQAHPQTAQYNTQPIQLDPRSSGNAPAFAASPSPATGPAISSLPVTTAAYGQSAPGPAGGVTTTPNISTSTAAAASAATAAANGGHDPRANSFTKSVNAHAMNSIKMYTPGYLPYSGQSMKFSFQPTNPEAVRLFGQNSFPSSGMAMSTYHPPNGSSSVPSTLPTREGSGTPNRPATGASAPRSHSVANGSPNGPTNGDVNINVSAPSAHTTERVAITDADEGDIVQGKALSKVKSEEKIDFPVAVHSMGGPIDTSTRDSGAPTSPVPAASGFTAINNGGEADSPEKVATVDNPATSSTNPGSAAVASASSPVTGSATPTVSRINGNVGSPDHGTRNHPSRFPHGGAVVIDQ